MNSKSTKQQKAYMQIGLIVGQVNIVENKIDELIANYYTKPDKASEFSREFSNRLRLADKLDLLKNIAKATGMNLEAADKGSISGWRAARNFAAHGIPGVNNEGMTMVLHNGIAYDLEKKFKEFGETHDKMIQLLDRYREALAT